MRGSASEKGRGRAGTRSDSYNPQLTRVAAVTVSIRAYNATGELDIRRDPFTLGTRVLLTCDVTGLPEGSEVVSYNWYHNCTDLPNSRCEIRDVDDYYRVVNALFWWMSLPGTKEAGTTVMYLTYRRH